MKRILLKTLNILIISFLGKIYYRVYITIWASQKKCFRGQKYSLFMEAIKVT